MLLRRFLRQEYKHRLGRLYPKVKRGLEPDTFDPIPHYSTCTLMHKLFIRFLAFSEWADTWTPWSTTWGRALARSVVGCDA